MTQSTQTHRDRCRVCGPEKEIRWSMPLEKVDGQWKSVPVCDKCRWSLIREARAEGRFIPFFSWDASQKEAAKRNAESKVVRQFVGKFGRQRDDKRAALKSSLIKIAAAR
jgi:hypothetical protein